MEYIRDLAVILIAAKFFSVVAKHYNLPEVVGEIIAGLIVGPCLLGVVGETEFLDEIAEIGVIMLMFEAGLGTDLKKLKATGVKATLLACAGVFVPLILGTILYMCFYGWGPVGSDTFLKGLFIGTIMTATSVSITVAVLKEMGVVNGLTGTTITSAAIIDDVIGIIVLTFVIGLKSGEADTMQIIIKSILFFALAIGLGLIIYRVFKWLDTRYQHTRRVTITGLVYCLLMAYIAEEFFGIADITGAFVAGVILCNLQDSEYIERRIDITAYMIFAPAFFAGIGLKVTFDTMNLKLLLFSIAFVIVALVAKVIGCSGVAKILKFNNRDALKIGAGMMTRGEVALITAQKGLSVGLLTAEFFTPVILLILVSSLVVPLLLKKLFADEVSDINPLDYASK
ncbi:MAG: cation:proton antiporter [Lachnospiraceae bacterium]|nr:cation:proton antiporter [Lachnospiraceae bacterium]